MGSDWYPDQGAGEQKRQKRAFFRTEALHASGVPVRCNALPHFSCRLCVVTTYLHLCARLELRDFGVAAANKSGHFVFGVCEFAAGTVRTKCPLELLKWAHPPSATATQPRRIYSYHMCKYAPTTSVCRVKSVGLVFRLLWALTTTPIKFPANKDGETACFGNDFLLGPCILARSHIGVMRCSSFPAAHTRSVYSYTSL